MDAVLGLISVLGFLICIVMLIISVIKKTGRVKKWAIGSVACFVVFVIAVAMPADPFSKSVSSTDATKVIEKTPEEKAAAKLKVKQDDEARVAALAKEKADAEAKVKSEAEAKKLPMVKLEGSVTPTIAQKGDKVTVRIDIENLDESKSIEGIKLLFSDKKFLEQGIIIVNVMGGGIQNGRAFDWQSEATNIPPKGKRSYQVIAQANTPGTYQSIIQVESPTFQIYSDPEGNSEMVAKLVVVN